jgi:hypothetical protein
MKPEDEARANGDIRLQQGCGGHNIQHTVIRLEAGGFLLAATPKHTCDKAVTASEKEARGLHPAATPN